VGIDSIVVTSRKVKSNKEPERQNVRKHYKSTHYTPQEKVKAITAIKLHGGLSDKALDEARKLVGSDVSKSTIWKWLQDDLANTVDSTLATTQPDLPTIINDTANDVIRSLQKATHNASKALETVPEITDAAAWSKIALGNGIVLTKLKELSGYSVEIEAILRPLQEHCRQDGSSYPDTLRDLVEGYISTPHDLTPPDHDGEIVGKA